jgi:hypothetical protein
VPDARPGWLIAAAAAAPPTALAVLVAHLALAPVAETDLFFRLASGAEILRQGGPFHDNRFSFTFPAEPYLDSAWLFDLGVALLHRAGGFPALVVAKAILLVGVFTGAWMLARRRGAHGLVSALVLAAAALLMAPRMVERPHLFSFAGEIALLAILHASRRDPRRLVLVPLLVALWANLHAGAFLAPVVLAATAAGAWCDRRRGGRRDHGRADTDARVGVQIAEPPPVPSLDASPRLLALAAVAALGALLLTPVGWGIFRYLAFHIGIYAVHPVDEFRAPDLTSDAPLVLGGAVALAGLLLFPARAPISWRQLLPLLLVGTLASRSVRFGADAVLLAAPWLAVRMTALLRTAPAVWARWRPSLPRCQARATALPLLLAVGAIAAIGAARMAAIESQHGAARTTGSAAASTISLGLAPGLVPEGAIRFVEDNQLGDRMYNDFDLGGYLAWRWYPRHQIFIDPRLPAYPRWFHALLGRTDLTRAAWDATLQSFAVDSALVTAAGINPRVAWWDPAIWALVWRAEDARIFVRRLPRWRALIEAHEIPATFGFTAEAGAETLPLAAPPPGSPVPACEWQLRLGDLLNDLDDGDDQRAAAAYARALVDPSCLPGPRRAAAAAWLGATRLTQRRFAEALTALDQAIAAGDGAGGADRRDDDEGGRLDPLLANRAWALEGLDRPADAARAWRTLAGRATGELARKASLRAAALEARDGPLH